jgi:ElaB/YqjD/DUF883 family membrane-anchored ribosome-binding protein
MTISKANERVVADLKLLVRDTEELLKATAGEAGEKLKDVRNRVAKAVESAKETCEDLQESTIKSAKEGAKAVDETVRSHPYESIGIAFGVGLLVGVLVSRR